MAPLITSTCDACHTRASCAAWNACSAWIGRVCSSSSVCSAHRCPSPCTTCHRPAPRGGGSPSAGATECAQPVVALSSLFAALPTNQVSSAATNNHFSASSSLRYTSRSKPATCW